MSYRHTLEAALESLQDIEELIKGFPDSGDVPSIELDLTFQKLRNIYELLLVLKKPAEIRTDQPVAAAPVPASAPVSATVAAPVMAPPVVTVTAPLFVPDPVTEQPAAPTAVPSAAPAAPPVSVQAPPGDEIIEISPRQPVTSHKDGTETQILSDRFKGRATLHETLHQSLGKENLFHAQGKPVENLMSAIGINDRFTFIRELFNGDTHAFEYAIKALNEAANFNDAYNYLMQNYDWDMDIEAVQLLLDIIRRKYITGRHE
jgi:hypothetical protein